MVDAAAAGDLDIEADVDVLDAADLGDEVLRHRPLQRAAPDEHHHAGGVPRKVHRRLTGGVGGPDDVHVLAIGVPGLSGRCPVVDAAAGEPIDTGRLDATVRHAGG